MKKLYAPWRQAYVTGAPEKKSNQNPLLLTAEDCVFCKQFAAHDDDAYMIIKRFSHCALIMNRYPYNIGHVMVLPYEHEGKLDQLSPACRTQMMEVASLATGIIGKALGTDGFNLGMSLGMAGEGSIPSHLHLHVLPRWRGDTSFLETLCETKLLSSDITKRFFEFKQAFLPVEL
jgi:ATP adenylyltransferase